MNFAIGAILGYLIGSAPTAGLVGKLFGADLRDSGTGNPGTANAMGVLGRKAALSLLVLDFAKGAVAVVAGRLIGPEGVGMVAGLGAMAGQILNPWFRFRGGKGLGTGGGVALAGWPVALPLLAPILVGAAKVLGAARGALIALALCVGLGAIWGFGGFENFWGVRSTGGLFGFAAGIALLAAPKFIWDVLTKEGAASPAE